MTNLVDDGSTRESLVRAFKSVKNGGTAGGSRCMSRSWYVKHSARVKFADDVSMNVRELLWDGVNGPSRTIGGRWCGEWGTGNASVKVDTRIDRIRTFGDFLVVVQGILPLHSPIPLNSNFSNLEG
jgi:hypothetical protein